MTSTHSGRQKFPLRPLFSRSVDEAASPVDKPGRITLPAQLLPHRKSATYNSRVEKQHANSRKRRGRTSPDLDQQFADGIEDTRREIRKAADEVLTEVERDAQVELAQVVEDFEEKLQLALDYETRAFQSIAEERLLITTLSPERKVVKKEEVIFEDRMQGFQQLVEEEEKVLESLWQEWTEIQTETVCLALEVLGPDEVAIDEEIMSVVTPEKVDGAIQCHAQHQDAFKDALEKMVSMQKSIQIVTSRTLKTLKDQQEELSAANKAAMSNVTRILEALEA